jgi:hypothetical protein
VSLSRLQGWHCCYQRFCFSNAVTLVACLLTLLQGWQLLVNLHLLLCLQPQHWPCAASLLLSWQLLRQLQFHPFWPLGSPGP